MCPKLRVCRSVCFSCLANSYSVLRKTNAGSVTPFQWNCASKMPLDRSGCAMVKSCVTGLRVNEVREVPKLPRIPGFARVSGSSMQCQSSFAEPHLPLSHHLRQLTDNNSITSSQASINSAVSHDSVLDTSAPATLTSFRSSQSHQLLIPDTRHPPSV